MTNYDMTTNAKAKSKFRRSSIWTNFRRRLRYRRKFDEITLQPLRSGFVVHHMRTVGSRGESDPATYEDTSDESKFRCYSKMTHKLLHYIFPYFLKDEAIIDRLRADLEEMKRLNK